MNNLKIFMGNIEKVSKTRRSLACFGNKSLEIYDMNQKTVPYKKNAFLIEIRKGFYVDLDQTKSLLGRLKLRKSLKLGRMNEPYSYKYGTFIMGKTGILTGDLVVSDQVKPVHCEAKRLGKIKKELKSKNIVK